MSKAKDDVPESSPLKYRQTLYDLRVQLVKLQNHVILNGQRVLIVLEGRDGAGKDGAIKRIVKHLSPRETRVVALAQAVRPGPVELVLSEVRAPSPGWGRDRAVQPQLVQPRRRRVGDGLLHGRGARSIP